jgi:hypothetical protein
MESKQADNKISQGRHDSRAFFGANLRTIFVERDIPNPMKPVLN